MPHPLRRVLSGGQTGADRAALDVALELGLPCGGWCPAGRLAEDGPIDPRSPLTETPSADPAERTTWNVRDGDGTLVLARPPLTDGTRLAVEAAEAQTTPLLMVPPDDLAQVSAVAEWLELRKIRVLNVAGPRESTCPGALRLTTRCDQAATFLRALLA
jgi:hypothetical protein